MNQKIKLVMSDIDGTLINKENKVSERTKKAVHDLIDSGIEFGVATGRNYDSAVGIVKQLGLDPHVVPIVSLNGIMVNHDSINYQFKDQTMGYEICKKIGLLGDKYYMGVLYFFEEKVYFHMDDLSVKDFELNAEADLLRFFKDDIKMQRIQSIEDIKPLFDAGEQVLKQVFIQNDDYTELVKERISNEFPIDYDLLMVGKGWAEIMPKSVNKGNAIREYAKFRGISMDEIMSFGDSDNDLTMIQKTGHGVAMKNARNSLKVLADAMTDSNVNDGVAQYIEKHLLKKA